MLNNRMTRKHAIILIILTVSLFALNKFLINSNNIPIYEMPDMVNKSHISSQRLFDNTWDVIRDNYYDSSMNHQVWKRWKEHYHGKIKTDEDAKVAIDTMLASLDDPYSVFLSKSEYDEQNNSINSKITGIGVNISTISGKTHIINVMEGTPAQFANLLPDDIILSIDGKDISGLSLSEVANLVRGPENTFVQLTILRNKDKLVKKVMRKEIKN